MDAKSYSQKYLKQELLEIQKSFNFKFHPELTLYEKAIIYKYSIDGYLEINKNLRFNKGANTTSFGRLIAQSLEKLKSYTSIVYRKVQLSKSQQNIYKKSLTNDLHIKEPAFSSTTKIKDIAMLFPGNNLFSLTQKPERILKK